MLSHAISLYGGDTTPGAQNAYQGIMPTQWPTVGKYQLSVGGLTGTTNARNDFLATIQDEAAAASSDYNNLSAVPWQSAPSAPDLRNVASRWRPVSGGVNVKYIGAPLDASGIIAAAPYPSEEFANEISFDSVQSLLNAKVVPAIDGVKAILLPTDSDPIFQPTRS